MTTQHDTSTPGTRVRTADGREGEVWADAPRKAEVWVLFDDRTAERHHAITLRPAERSTP